MTQLFAEDTVYISEQQDQKSVFKEIAHKLFEKGLVTEEYLDNLIDREEHYPTALPLSPIDLSLPKWFRYFNHDFSYNNGRTN